jgi:hypothetical protein
MSPTGPDLNLPDLPTCPWGRSGRSTSNKMSLGQLQFTAPESRFHPSFWEALYSNTLNKYNLNQEQNSVAQIQSRSDRFELYSKNIQNEVYPALYLTTPCSPGNGFDFSSASFDERNVRGDKPCYRHRGLLFAASTLEVGQIAAENVCIVLSTDLYSFLLRNSVILIRKRSSKRWESNVYTKKSFLDARSSFQSFCSPLH